MKLLRTFAIALVALTATAAQADEWIDTGTADSFMNFGARIGFNTSNATTGLEGAAANLDSWGTGFDLGVVANLNFMQCLSVQPGFFFESRSHNYSYVTRPGTVLEANTHEYGHTRNTQFKVPVMAVFTMDPVENVRWSIDFGPVFNFGIGGSDKGTYEVADQLRSYKDGYYDQRAKFDLGLKMGTGLTVLEHYYLGLHYEAGTCHVWKGHKGGHNKSWQFTLGYNF